MKIRVADYIADMLLKNDIQHVFTVTGGGAMYLNDALGHKEGLTCIYQHHEQACAMAAESYARVQNQMAAVCVTTGPGGTNALTGVLGAWLDSIPMLVLSGQVRYETTVRSTGLCLRSFGDQEFDITRAAGCMAKYAQMVTEPESIRYCLEKAFYLAKSCRPGPCWLDIPLDVQGALIDPGLLQGYNPVLDKEAVSRQDHPPQLSEDIVDLVIQKIQKARHPVLYAGNGVRICKAAGLLLRIAQRLEIPVVTGWNSIDLICDAHPLYAGRAGIMGDRAGNWAVQNCDLLLSIGSRLSIRQVGYAWESWAGKAYTIVQDIDREELKKPSIHVDMPVWADAYELLAALDRKLKLQERKERNLRQQDLQIQKKQWIQQCQEWRKQYPVVQKRHMRQQTPANVYAFVKVLSEALPEGRIIVVGNGSASVVGSHAFVIKPHQRFLINSGAASMGYDLPAAIGACFAAGGAEIICITGDGSIQMNIQELQTIVHHRLPIKIFVIQNGGYHSIRQTQNSMFKTPLVGVGSDSGDLSFPSMEKLAWAYGYPYYRLDDNEQLAKIPDILGSEGFCICEVAVDIKQCFEPKSATKKLSDGGLVSLPLEDLAPHLPKEVLEHVMQS